VAKKNSKSKNHHKAIEELMELGLELMQRVNKPHKNNDQAIVKEIADVKIRMWYLEKHYGPKNIKKAINNKLKLLEKNVNIRRRID